MIDVHCHLEQKDYDNDRDDVIERCKKELKAIITSCAHPNYFDLTIKMVEKYKNFVFTTCSIHPEYVKEISKNKIDDFIKLIKKNKDKIVGIGETGLDFWYIKEKSWREKQKELFIKMINLAKELGKPIVIHSRNSEEDCIEILENNNAKNVLMHMFGANQLTKRVIDNGWLISVNAIILMSKKHKKVVRDTPIEKLLLETDAPWLNPETLGKEIKKRNDSLTIKLVAEKIADIKKTSFEQVWNQCGKNAINFFKLSI
ncbi:MAG: TatD family hydrolase [Candidatus Aenigmatarchaeota archaeon]